MIRLILNFFDNIYNNRKSLLIFIFLISILCSLIFLFFLRDIGPIEHRVPGSDYLVYYEPIANNILQGKGFTLEGKVIPFIEPGFPVILSGIFALSQLIGIDKLDLVVVFNVIFTAIACCFLFLLAREIFNKKIALIASFLWMSYPFNLWFLKNPNTEMLFIPLLYAGIWLYILALKPVRGQWGSAEAQTPLEINGSEKKHRENKSLTGQSKQTSNGVKRKNLRFVFFGGVILGLASLTRLIGLFLPFFLVLLIFFFLRDSPKRRQFLLAAILLIGTLGVIVPWGIYTFLEAGSSVPIYTMGSNGVVFGFTTLLNPVGDGGVVPLSNDMRTSLERIKRAEELNSENNIFSPLIQELVNNPLTFAKLTGLRILRAWYATYRMWWEDKILAVQSIYLITGLFGIIYGIRVYRKRIKGIVLLLGIVFYFWGITVLANSILRYMVPAMGLVIIFSAITVNFLITYLVNRYLFKSSKQEFKKNI